MKDAGITILKHTEPVEVYLGFDKLSQLKNLTTCDFNTDNYLSVAMTGSNALKYSFCKSSSNHV